MDRKTSDMLSTDENPCAVLDATLDAEGADDEECVNESVARADVGPESEKDLQFKVEKLRAEYGSRFRSADELEYFAMLPLSEEAKRDVFARAMQFQKEEKNLCCTEIEDTVK
jgi:hypothetical protein